MTSGVHIIRQQYLHVELNGTESEGFALQHSLPGLCQHWLTPAIERALERFAPSDGYLYIERLEIDAGTMTLERLERDLPDALTKVIEESLRDQLQAGGLVSADISGNVQHKTAHRTINEALCHFLRTGTLPWSFRLSGGHSLEQAILASWREAQKSGVDPFRGGEPILWLLADETVRKRLLWQFSPAFLETLLSRVSPSSKVVIESLLNSAIPSGDRKYFEQTLWEVAFARLAAGHDLMLAELAVDCWMAGMKSDKRLSPAGAEVLFALACPEGKAAIDEVSDALCNPAISAADRACFGELLCARAFDHLAIGRIPAIRKLVGETWLAARRSGRQLSPVFPEVLFALLAPESRPVVDGMLRALRDANVSDESGKYFGELLWEKALVGLAVGHALRPGELVAEAWDALPQPVKQDAGLAGALELCWPGTTGGRVTQERLENIFRSLDRAEAEQVLRSSDSAGSGRPDAGKDNMVLAEGGYVENAGLVLLHPFLPQFFTALGIADDNLLLKPERALCLMHFLVTGQLVAPEYKLVLPKILCNVSLESPVASDVELTGSELEEASALLDAVIRHWDVLRNTSPDGLRGTFLLRPGKVSMRGADWLLQVESRSCDILLDQLPWGIGAIKLPWMNKMLWVEWH